MLIFTIDVDPEPYVKTRFYLNKSKQKIYGYNPQEKYLEQIKWQVKPYAPEVPLTSPILMDITFYLPIPKTTSGIKKRQMLNGRIYHIKRPDLDNLAYNVTNALKGIIYADDSQIIDMHFKKIYGEKPKIVVKVSEQTNIEEGTTSWIKV
jgi:Holliday junction resolvase RusA-like endonuclease